MKFLNAILDKILGPVHISRQGMEYVLLGSIDVTSRHDYIHKRSDFARTQVLESSYTELIKLCHSKGIACKYTISGPQVIDPAQPLARLPQLLFLAPHDADMPALRLILQDCIRKVDLDPKFQYDNKLSTYQQAPEGSTASFSVTTTHRSR